MRYSSGRPLFPGQPARRRVRGHQQRARPSHLCRQCVDAVHLPRRTCVHAVPPLEDTLQLCDANFGDAVGLLWLRRPCGSRLSLCVAQLAIHLREEERRRGPRPFTCGHHRHPGQLPTVEVQCHRNCVRQLRVVHHTRQSPLRVVDCLRRAGPELQLQQFHCSCQLGPAAHVGL